MNREFDNETYTLYTLPMMTEQTEQMKPRGIKFPSNLWEAAKEKAGTMPLSVILRRLLEKWVKGEISLD